MRFVILLHYPELGAAGRLDDEALQQGQIAFQTYATELHEAGALVSAEVLKPSALSTTLRAEHGMVIAHPGARTLDEQQLGGIVTVEVADQDEAVAWARKAPSAQWGAIEVRPSATHVVDGVWTA